MPDLFVNKMSEVDNQGQLIKLLQVKFTNVAIVLKYESNSYTCKSFIKLTLGSQST